LRKGGTEEGGRKGGRENEVSVDAFGHMGIDFFRCERGTEVERGEREIGMCTKQNKEKEERRAKSGGGFKGLKLYVWFFV